MAAGEIRRVDPDHTAFTILGMTTSYFAAAPILSEIAGRNLLAPHAVAARKRALLDFLDHGLDGKKSEGPMTGRKFILFIAVVFVVALAIYLITTPRGNDIPLIGVIDGNEVIVSPQITGRIIKLTVDEGSEVKKGDLIAELDPQRARSEPGRRPGQRRQPGIASQRGESQLLLDERSDRCFARQAEGAR